VEETRLLCHTKASMVEERADTDKTDWSRDDQDKWAQNKTRWRAWLQSENPSVPILHIHGQRPPYKCQDFIPSLPPEFQIFSNQGANQGSSHTTAHFFHTDLKGTERAFCQCSCQGIQEPLVQQVGQLEAYFVSSGEFLCHHPITSIYIHTHRVWSRESRLWAYRLYFSDIRKREGRG
jgi:hypothetical protein